MHVHDLNMVVGEESVCKQELAMIMLVVGWLIAQLKPPKKKKKRKNKEEG